MLENKPSSLGRPEQPRSPVTVFQGTDGKWYIHDDDGTITNGPFPTNAEAWRFIDRITGQPTTKREDTVDWINRKSLS